MLNTFIANEAGFVMSFAKLFGSISVPLFFTSSKDKAKKTTSPLNEETAEILFKNVDEGTVSSKTKDGEAIRSETKSNKPESNEPESNETKRNETKRHKKGSNETKRIEMEKMEDVNCTKTTKTIQIESINENDKIEEKEEVIDKTVVDGSILYDHLKTYPIINTWIKVLHWTPLPRVVRPVYVEIENSNTLSPYSASINAYIDAKFNSVDATIPYSIQDLAERDTENVISDGLTKKIAYKINNTLSDVGALTNKTIIDPSRNRVQRIRDLRGEYITFMGNQPIIRSQFNLLVKKVNERLTEDINKYLLSPEQEIDGERKEIQLNYVTLDEESKDLAHTVQLINLVILNSRPILQERLYELSKKPSHINSYVSSLYQESKQDRGEGRVIIIIASLETIRKLTEDGHKVLSATKFFEFLQSEPCEKEKISIAEETIVSCVDDAGES